MNRTGCFGENKAVGVIAAVLAVLTLVMLFLPMLALKNTEQLGQELLSSVTEGMLSGSSAQELLDAMRDDGVVRGIAHAFASVRLSSLGRESSGYGYYDDSLEERIDDLDDTLARYFDDVENELYGLVFGGPDVDAVMRTLGDSAFQEALGEFLFCSLLYSVYDNGLERTLDVKSTMTSIQRTILALEDGKLSPVEMLRVQGAARSLLRVLNNGVLSNSVFNMTSASLNDSIRRLKWAQLGYGALLALYAASAIMALAGIVLGRRRIALPGACCVTVLALVNTIIAYFRCYQITRELRSQLGSVLRVNASANLFAVTAWPVISVIVGLALTAIMLLLWQADGGVTRPQGRVVPTPAGWRCPACGTFCEEKQNFCAQCGTKRPETRGFCPYCGAKIGEGDLFCQQCGTRL